MSGFVLAAFVAVLAAALVAAFGPTYATCSAVSGGVTRCGRATGYSINGSRILVVVSVPVLLSLLPIIVRARGARIVSAVLLWGCCAIGAASIGLFFVPGAILMTIAAARHDRTDVVTQPATIPSRPS
ncbi:MAG: hypothetical protein M3P43_06870 [Actinomycetota bacterium]|nr:hypothetical protein [Actinomycetota bacterium]